jgi:hypothetical protein
MLAEAIVLIPKSANKGTEIQMDVLPLVLCKDCKHMKVMPCDIHGHIPIYCTNLGIYSEGLAWFCADGERKE